MSRDRGAEAAAVASAFDPDELTLARKFRGLRKNELAQAIGVTPAALSQYELGQSRPSPAVLARLALALGVPVRFFVLGHPKPVTPSAAHFRSLRATTQLERDQALAFGQLAWRLMTGIEKYIELPASRIPHAALPAEPGAAARRARESMGIGTGPVPHVVRLLEAHGVVVIGLPATSPRVDAFSHWYGSRPLIFLSPIKYDKARSRFDAAHELGHLVLHHDAEPGNRIVENQAHDFAAEFLMPREEIAGELPRRLDWDLLFQAKRRWGASLKALVYRAHKLGILGESAYRAGMVTLARWGDPEPGDLGPREIPVLLAKAIQMLAESGVDVETVAKDAGLAAGTVKEIMRAADGARPRMEMTLLRLCQGSRDDYPRALSCPLAFVFRDDEYLVPAAWCQVREPDRRCGGCGYQDVSPPGAAQVDLVSHARAQGLPVHPDPAVRVRHRDMPDGVQRRAAAAIVPAIEPLRIALASGRPVACLTVRRGDGAG